MAHKYVRQTELSHHAQGLISIQTLCVSKDVIYVTETPIADVEKFAARTDVTIMFVSEKQKNQDDAQCQLVVQDLCLYVDQDQILDAKMIMTAGEYRNVVLIFVVTVFARIQLYCNNCLFE